MATGLVSFVPKNFQPNMAGDSLERELTARKETGTIMKEGLRRFILYDCNYDKAIQQSDNRERLVERRLRERMVGNDTHAWGIFELVNGDFEKETGLRAKRLVAIGCRVPCDDIGTEITP